MSYVWEKNNQEKMSPLLGGENLMLTDGKRRQNSYFACLSTENNLGSEGGKANGIKK